MQITGALKKSSATNDEERYRGPDRAPQLHRQSETR